MSSGLLGSRSSLSVRADRKGEDGFTTTTGFDLKAAMKSVLLAICLRCWARGILANGNGIHPVNTWSSRPRRSSSKGGGGRNLAATPGFGRHSDLWLMELETRRFFRLTNTPDDGTSGVLHRQGTAHRFQQSRFTDL
jgi:hypothetical protein